MKRQKTTCHDTLEADYIFCRINSCKAITSRCNYFYGCTGVFDEPEGLTLREGGHFIWWFFRSVFKAMKGDAPAVHHQIR